MAVGVQHQQADVSWLYYSNHQFDSEEYDGYFLSETWNVVSKNDFVLTGFHEEVKNS